MRKILYVFGAILVLIIAAAVIVPLTIDPNNFKQEITKAVEEKSGYKLEIAGDIKLSALPILKANINDVSVSDGKHSPFVKVKELHAYVSVRPLLSGKVEVGEIKIVEPKLTLVQKGKENNWTAKLPKKTAEKTTDAKEPGKKQQVKISDFSIVDGDVSFDNNGNALKVQKINLNAGFENEDVDLKKFTANIFGGSVNANGNIKLGEAPATDIKFNLKNFQLAQIAQGLMRNKRVEKGSADLSGNISAKGMTPDKIFATLNGAGKLSAKEIAVRGFDMGAFSKAVQNIKSPTDILPLLNSFRSDDQSTKINSVAGDFSIKNGLVTIPGMKMEADYAQGDYSGTINLPGSTMNTLAKFNLLNLDKQASPKVGLIIAGAMSSPAIRPELSDLTNWAIKKYGGKLMEKVPEKYRGFLSGF